MLHLLDAFYIYNFRIIYVFHLLEFSQFRTDIDFRQLTGHSLPTAHTACFPSLNVSSTGLIPVLLLASRMELSGLLQPGSRYIAGTERTG